MTLIKEMKEFQKTISGRILFDENLAKFSWFKLGGPAKILFIPENVEELSFFLKKFNKTLPIKVLGRGSNTLIRDKGFDGIIIKFGEIFSKISLYKENCLIAGTSALDTNVSKFAHNHNLSDFEFLSCIPGSIGGAIRMNSGCYEKDISQILVSVSVIDLSGNIKKIPISEIKFHYRGSDLNEEFIFISAIFKGLKSDKSLIEKKMNYLKNKKKQAQPSGIKTCGSTFKNPKDSLKKKAWELIKIAKCEGMSFGDAKISEKHLNFFVNNGSAKAKDLEKLICAVKDKVFKSTGVKLELELQIIGEPY